MPRRRSDDSINRLIEAILTLYFISLVLFYFSNKQRFWNWIIYGVVIFILLVASRFGWRYLKDYFKNKHYRKIYDQIEKKNLDSQINNFISSFGLGQDKSRNPWRYGNYSFDWRRLNYFQDYLSTQGLDLASEELTAILEYYIDERETKRTIGGSRNIPQYFNNLSGADFERLLYRLFEKMGYTVQYVGKMGDQGGDLILEKGIDRILVQAKCYRDWQIGNEAIQQAVAAQKYYNCNGAMVVTNSTFTPHAIDLAKVNNVQLIPKQELQKLLLENLKENWV